MGTGWPARATFKGHSCVWELSPTPDPSEESFRGASVRRAFLERLRAQNWLPPHYAALSTGSTEY